MATTTKRVSISVTYKKAYDSRSITAEHEKLEKKKKEEAEAKIRSETAKAQAKEDREKAKESKKRAREHDIDVRSCKADGCESRYTVRSTGWMYCDTCVEFGICRQHWGADDTPGVGRAIMQDHEAVCGRPQRKRRRTMQH